MAAAVLSDNTPTQYPSPQQPNNNNNNNSVAVDIVQRLQRDVQCLSDANKALRRRAVERLTRETVDCSPPHSKEVLSVIYEVVHKPLLKLFADEVDRTRELAVVLTSRMCKEVNKVEQYLPYIIPTIHDRLGGDEVKEPTEEIRVLLVEMLSQLCALCGGEQTGVYINELVQILQKCILDPFADVRKVSCKYTCELAAVAPQRFYQQGESLIDALLKALSHQHNKVRTTVLKTIGVVVLATSGKAVNDVFTHIAQRTFDHSPTVRLMVTEVAGEWILKLRDRYSFFQKLIPLLLSGFSDEMKDVEEKSKEYYKLAGELYERENEEEFKEKVEYTTTKHFQHLLQHNRPNLGCRVLIQRNFSKILPAIVNDLTDWNLATRVKTSSLLYWLVLHCEDHITMNMQMLSQALYKGAGDEEPSVVEEVMKTARLVGMFVEPSIYCKLILPHIESSHNPHSLQTSLHILTQYIIGSNHQLLTNEIAGICVTLGKGDVSNVVDGGCHVALVKCVDALIDKCGIDHSSVSCQLFTILLNVLSTTSDVELQHNIRTSLDNLSRMINFTDRFHLFETYSPTILSRLKDTCTEWTSQSSDFLQFLSLLSESGRALCLMLQDAVAVLVQCCEVGRDPEMRQRVMTMTSQLVTSPLVMEEESGERLRDEWRKYAVVLIKEVILPNCVWVAGRTAAAVRAISISMLWALLTAHIVTNEHLVECFTPLHTQLTSCLDCHNETTRTVAIKVMWKLLQCCEGAGIEVDVLHVIYPEVLKRMDDSSQEVRVLTTKTMTQFFRCLPSTYDKEFYKLHLELILRTMLLHMDDVDEHVQEGCKGCLVKAAEVHPGLLLRMAEDAAGRHRRKEHCEDLKKLCVQLLQQQQEGS